MAKIQLRRDTLANWLAVDPILLDGEKVLVATDPDKPKVYDSERVGDGTTKFSELPIPSYGGGGEIDEERIEAIEAKMDILYKVALSLTGSKHYKKGTSQTPKVNWTVQVNKQDVTPVSQVISCATIESMKNGITLDTSVRTYTLPTSISTNTTVTLKVDGTTANATFDFYNPAYYGVVDQTFSNAPTAADVTALTELTNYGTKTYDAAKITATGSKKICYAYPKTLGALTAVLDPDKQSWLDSFTRSEVTINEESYYVYVKTSPANLNGVDYTYN